MTLELTELQRDWIEGSSDADFMVSLHHYRARLEALSPEDQARGALIAEADPVEFAAAFFAAILTGVPAILANPSWGMQERAELARLVDPATYFGQNLMNSPDPAATKPPARSILIPTGGTTGGVKLAIHTWASLSAAVPGLQTFLGGGPIHSACQLPLYHVSGLMQLVRSFLTGGRIHFGKAVSDGDCLSFVPTQLQRAMESKEDIRKLNTARAIFVGGAGMPDTVAMRARMLRLPVIPVYGMTETAAMAAAVPNEDFLEDSLAGAVPLGETRFSIESGQIRVQTPALFQGYQGRGRIDLSQGYLTGDAGKLDANGRLHAQGRLDHLLITGGEKVDPREVEAALLEIEGITTAHVYGEPHLEWGQAVVAQLSCSPDLDFENVRARLKTKLATYKVPKCFYRLDPDTSG